MESLRGPAFSNWVIRGHVLQGPHPASGSLGADSMVRVLRELLEAGVTTFVCLQDEMPSSAGASSGVGAGAGTRYGAPKARVRSAYGAGNVVTAKPYIDQAQMVAEAAGMPQVAGGGALSFVHVPVRDAEGGVAPDDVLKRLVTDLAAHIRAGEVLYLHCSDGNGRSGAVAAALLGAAYGLSSSEAIDAVQRSRGHRHGAGGRAPETHEQKMQVHRVLGGDALRKAVAAAEPRRSGQDDAAASREASSVLAHVRTLLQRRGPSAVCDFRSFLGTRCDVGPGAMSPRAAADALAEAGLYLTAAETHAVLAWLQASTRGGPLAVSELVDGVRGRVSPARRDLIHAVFRKLDTSAVRVVSMDDIAVSFHAAGHPDVRSGRRSAESVQAEFQRTFGVDTRGRTVTLADFESYWGDVSAAVPDDSTFKMTMWGVWKLDGSELGEGGRSAGLGSSQMRGGVGIVPSGADGDEDDTYGGRVPKSPADAAASLKHSLLTHGGEFGVAKLGGSLRDIAARAKRTHGDEMVELVEFRAALRGAGALMDDDDEQSAAECFAPLVRAAAAAGRRELALAEDVETAVGGPLTEDRQRLAAAAFAALDGRCRGGGSIPARELAGMFRAERHPSVTAGRRSPDAVMRDFLVSLGRGDPSDGGIRLPLFERLCAGIAAAYPDDGVLRLVLWQCFDLSAGSSTQGSTVHRPTAPVDVHRGASVAARAAAGEAGFLQGVDRLASGRKATSTAPRVDSHRQHFASHPAKHTSAVVIGSSLEHVGGLASPFATRAGYGLGSATKAGSKALSSGARRVEGHPNEVAAATAATVLDDDGTGASYGAYRVLTPASKAPPSSAGGSARRGGGYGRTEDAATAVREDPAFTYARGGDRGRRPNVAAETALRADSAGRLVASAPDEADVIRSALGRRDDDGHADDKPGPASRVHPAVARARDLLASRGVRPVFALLKWLGIAVTDHPALLEGGAPERAVPTAAFCRRLREHGLGLSARDASDLADLCADADAPGCVQLRTVLACLCPPLSAPRSRLVDHAFDALAAKLGASAPGSGEPTIPVGEARVAFASGAHPHVRSGRRTEADVLREFLESFFPSAPDETPLRRLDFEAYHQAMSAGLPQGDEAFFTALVWAVWELQEAPTAARGIADPTGSSVVPAAGRGSAPSVADHLGGASGMPSPMSGLAGSPYRRAAGGAGIPNGGPGFGIERLGWTPAVNVASRGPPSPGHSVVTASAGGPEAVCDRLRATVARRGAAAFLDLARHLRAAGGSPPGPLPDLTAVELQHALTAASVGLSPREMRVVLDGIGDGGHVSGERLLADVVGPMNATRRELVDKAWQAVSNGEPVISAEEAAVGYRCEAHADVRAGRKTEREAMTDFVAPLLEAGGPGATPSGVMLGPEDWHRHFAMISAGIPDDGAFRLMMWETFALGQ